jgi:hypothetical protein
MSFTIDPIVAEAVVVRKAVAFCIDLGIQRVIVEGDEES